MKVVHRLRKLKSFQSFVQNQSRSIAKQLENTETSVIRQTGKSLTTSLYLYSQSIHRFNRRVFVKQIMSGSPFKTKLIF